MQLLNSNDINLVAGGIDNKSTLTAVFHYSSPFNGNNFEPQIYYTTVLTGPAADIIDTIYNEKYPTSIPGLQDVNISYINILTKDALPYFKI